jgi:tetratricopeptide (TPR) repeat protein
VFLVTKRRRLFLFISLVIILVGLSILIRPGIAIYDESLAGQTLNRLMAASAGISACELMPNSNKDQAQIQEAISALNQAILYSPGSAQAYLLLGRAMCLSGKPEKAIEAFTTYVYLNPRNPFGHLELGFAEENLCALSSEPIESIPRQETTIEIETCQNPEIIQKIRQEWNNFGIDTNQFLALARNSFSVRRYLDATVWYQRALKFQISSIDDLPVSDQYKWAVSSIIGGVPIPQPLLSRVPIIKLADRETVPANQFRWLIELPDWKINYGDQLASKLIGNDTAGILYWSGQAGFITEVTQDGWYQVSIRAQNTLPAPVILQLENNFQSFGKVELARGDLSWQVFQCKVFLSKGFHLIDVNYINDAVIEGVDRDAVLNWIKFDLGG